MNTAARLSLSLLVVSLIGCPSPVVTPPADTGVLLDTPAIMVDAGPVGTDGGPSDIDGGPSDIDGGPSDIDAASPGDAGSSTIDAPPGVDGGVTTSWNDCREAVIFGVEGEACAFSGSCVECALVVMPRQVLCMSGRLRVAAAGPGACATGTDAGVFTFPDAGPRADAGVGVDGGGVCPPLVLADPVGGVCQPSTVDCIRGGGSPSACITADPPCLSCAQTEIAACATRSGCDDEAGRANCCFEANCPGGACSATTCATPWNAYVACAGATTCGVTDLCFPSAPTCPPAGWPAPSAVGCTMATRTCIEAATTAAQTQACIDADTTGAPPAGAVCGECVNDGLLSCASNPATPNDCGDELGLVVCCLDTACPTADATCRNAAVATGGACAGTWDAFITCANATITAGDCGIVTSCFP